MKPEETVKPLKIKTYSFGEFRLEAENLLLLRNSEVVPLSPKACEVLLTLVSANGKLISKEEIFDKVWADIFVEETNLTHHISALRKALGKDENGGKFIETVPRRGYRFVAPVSELENGAAEIVVSERTIERFVEEIEIETTAGDAEQIGKPPGKQISPVASRRVSVPNRSAIFVAAGVLLAALIGFAAFNFVSRADENNQVYAARSEPISYTSVSDGRNVGATTISPDGKFAAYIQNFTTEAGGTLYIKQIETNREVRLLEPDERTFGNIDFSPDGSLIYYISFEKNSAIGALYSISILGGMPKRLFNLDAESSYFAVSPDNREIAFYRSSSETATTSLVVAALDGTTGERILHSHPSAEPSFLGFLAWSPDGRVLATSKFSTSDRQPDASLYELDLETGETGRLTDENFTQIGKMRFSPDGRELLFVARNNSFSERIFALDLASRRVRLVTNDNNSYGNYGLGITSDGKILAADLTEMKADLWSVVASGDASDAVRVKPGETNGRRGIAVVADNRLAYIARTGDKFDIWTVKSDGADAQMLTNDAFQERDLTASRDGRLLAFSSNRADGKHLYRMNHDGSDVKQLTFGETDDAQPDFSPDGKWIVYISGQGENTIIKKIPVEGGASVELTDFFGINPVFSPDGSRIALKILSGSRSLPGKIVVVPAAGGKPEYAFPITDFEYFNLVHPIRWMPDGTGIIFYRERNSVGNLWQQNLDASSAPRQLTNFTSDTIYNFVYSADGTRIFLSRGLWQNNAVLIRNF